MPYCLYWYLLKNLTLKRVKSIFFKGMNIITVASHYYKLWCHAILDMKMLFQYYSHFQISSKHNSIFVSSVFIHSFIHPSIHPSIHSSIHSFIPLFIYLFIYLFVYLFTWYFLMILILTLSHESTKINPGTSLVFISVHSHLSYNKRLWWTLYYHIITKYCLYNRVYTVDPCARSPLLLLLMYREESTTEVYSAVSVATAVTGVSWPHTWQDCHTVTGSGCIVAGSALLSLAGLQCC